ncbi:FecR domain-containing protein [Dyadobacter sp. CY261]|uniref:FecR family protein n=1 Tax=Dyadobacter sp. CY261 TaxID=2907203 RepID=UPI001F24428F|nr:FecR family protein [Dyadobacter sp. CY261]MCF0069049.1 FecR domain-containing protein [Dyadobacter sp. CY261]
MNQHEFDILLQKYLAGTCSPDEEQQVLEWSERVHALAPEPLTGTDQKITEQRIWKQIRQNVLPVRMFNPVIRIAVGIAAAVLLTLGLYMLRPGIFDRSKEHSVNQLKPASKPLAHSGDYLVFKNTLGNAYTLTLEDGSEIILAKESTLRYPRHFDPKNRQVELEGEAVFNIKRDTSRPFFVYSGELVTQVLGTSFKVTSFGNARTIEVQVLSGKVSVYENQEKSPEKRNGVILRPNQKITFDKDAKRLVPELVAAPIMVEQLSLKRELAFEESPLQTVLNALQKAYDVEIVVENPALNNCTFTGDITDLPLYTQLRFICKSVNASYELRGTTVFMNGEGCPK